ncbi:hypothetical protein CHS0354_033715 [Potamilus streckersoni]|uniref:Lebercilin domain-containing protein n=1 Tax=Potamilus streckersoni TaxID=2493646 RepID=A0AAE0S2E0_9BIVA|nr:hypothetical protein CHS0354_033715 [Potamilus streckersoni]
MATRKKSDVASHDDDDYPYSEDFDSDDEDIHNKKRTPINMNTDRKKTKSKSDRSRGRGRGRGKGRRSRQGRISQEPKVDNITQRVMSARRLRINELKNQLEELNTIIRDLKEENKLLKKTQLIQEKSLNRFESRESDLPQLMERHNNEMKMLKEQLKKTKEKYDRTDRYLRDAEDELEKMKSKLKKYKELAENKDLLERDELNQKYRAAEIDLEEKDVKIKELEKYIANLQKNHRHEIGIEIARQKDSNKQLQHLQEENVRLNEVIKEKQKEIEMKNIYSSRAIKPPHRLPASYNGTPHETPPPRPGRKRAPSLSDITPREKAKLYAEKRLEEDRKQREIRENYADNKKFVPRVRRREKINRGARGENSKQHAKLKREQEIQRWEEEERRKKEEERKEREERERLERERQKSEENLMIIDRQREEEEKQLRKERERLKREAEERERLEQKKRDEQERQEQQEREERNRRDRERMEQEKRAEEARIKMETDAAYQEERKRKDMILQKLREIDEGKNINDTEKKPKSNKDEFFITNARSDSLSNDSLGSSKKSYNFTKPVENMHHGKPAHEDVTVPVLERKKRREVNLSDIERGGYQPSFVEKSSGTKDTRVNSFDDEEPIFNTKKKNDKKSDLMTHLFGDTKDTKTANKDGDIKFPSPTPAKTGGGGRSFPWDDPKPTVKSNAVSSAKRENSSALFGGGSALIEDDLQTEAKHSSTTGSAKNVPRRARQSHHFNRSKVPAVDNDDDIEEVIL